MFLGKGILENLWIEYFSEECAKIDPDEKRALLKKVAEMRKNANALLTGEQREVLEKYVETLYEMQDFWGKKAFFKECTFATSFLFEAKDF